MFSSNFLSGGNPLSAMSSAVNKFGLFGDETSEEKQQQQPPGSSKQKDHQQQGNGQPASQGPQRQSGPQPQGMGRGGQGVGRGGSQPQGAGRGGSQPQAAGQGGSQPQGAGRGGSHPQGAGRGGSQPQGAGRGGSQPQGAGRGGFQPQAAGRGGSPVLQGAGRGGLSQQGAGRGGLQHGTGGGESPKHGVGKGGPRGPGSRPPSTEPQEKSGSGAGVKTLCPVCKNTELNLKSKDSLNHNTCTQCKSEVCNMCGFSPPDATAKEWLCLNCQMQRALGGAESSGPPTLKAQSQPKDNVPSQNLAKKDTPHSKQMPPSASPPTKPTQSQKQSSQSSTSAAHTSQQTTQQKPPTKQTTQGAPPAKSEPPSKTDPPKKEEESSFFGFGFGGTRSRSPSPQPGASSVSGKVLGFGSSFLSSASNLISATQDENSTTPPTSRKGSTISQTSAKITTPPSSRKGSEASKGSPNLSKSLMQEGKTQQQQNKPQDTQKPTTITESPSAQATKVDQSPKLPPKSCPLCKALLRKDPLNYSTCTECKTIVCNQCGFNPVPHQTEAKEWLCLNCQTQRALKGIEPPGQPTIKSKTQPSKSNKMDSTLGPLEKQSSTLPTMASPANQPAAHKKEMHEQQTSAVGAKQAPSTKPVQQQTVKNASSPSVSKASPKAEAEQEQSGFFGLGFGGARSRSPSPQPAVSAMSGKVLGFGSSFLNSASNLISSAVQDEPSTTNSQATSVSQISLKTNTPPMPRKGSTTSNENQSVGQKEDKKIELTADLNNKAPISQPKKGEPSLLMPKADKNPQPLPKSCPLCKVEIKKDLANYQICTECKTTVCNLCGFNPTPHQTELKEWLCLNCQTQRALKGMEPPGPPKLESAAQAKKQPASKPLVSPLIQKEGASELDKLGKKIGPPQKLQDQQSKAPNGALPIQKAQQQEHEAKSEVSAKSAKEESGFFGFGGARSRSPSPQPAVSAVSGKVLGFGSSFLSSASNLISTAVLDETSTTPPTSRKASTVSQGSTPTTSRKSSAVPQMSNTGDTTQTTAEKQETYQQASKSSMNKTADKSLPTKVDKTPLPLPKSCPLCKADITSVPPNFSSCTDCKTIVCNRCGFNPMPHEKEVKEWLCLSCQIKRASEPSSLDPKLQSKLGLQQDKRVQHQPPPQNVLNEKSPAQKESIKPQQPKDASVSAKSEITTQSDSSKTDTGFFGFGFGGVRSRSPSPQPVVSEKVLGFGSSFLSSASNLISSVVQDESSTTPPTPRKGSTVSQSSVKSTTPPTSRKDSLTVAATSRKGSTASQDSVKTQPGETKILSQKLMEDKKSLQDQILKAPSTSPSKPQSAVKSSQLLVKNCPLCKVELKKDPPNFNTCTECKSIVCNLCGFNPMPHQTEANEWLCLTCQVQRASVPKDQAKITTPVPKKEKDLPESLQKKQHTKEATNAGHKSPVAGGKEPTADLPQQVRQPKTQQQMKSDKPLENQSELPPKTEPHQEGSGFFGFGFGGARSRSPSPQPAVSGKVLGFGSSFLSTASNLISSAVQDEPSTTPPTSRKSSSVSETTILPGSRKGSSVAMQESQKTQPSKDTKPSIEQKKEEKTQLLQQVNVPSRELKDNLKMTKDSPKPLPKVCPLCKVDLKKDQYNSCTECKNIVCNLCGFNPMPHQNEVMWLCLACQMQKAPEPPPVQLQSHAKKPEDTVQMDKKPQVPGKQDYKQTSAATVQPAQKETQKQHITDVSKSESQKTDPQQDKVGFFGFGFGGARSRSPSPQPAVSERVLGFGSSFLSSASNLISTTPQDESSTTPSSSRKASTASQMSDKTPPTSRKGSAVSQISNKVNTTPASSRKGSQTSIKTTPPTSQKGAEADVNINNADGAKTKVPEKGEETNNLVTSQQQEQGKAQDGASLSSELHEDPRSRSQSPLLPPAASAVSGKVLGFGSSLFSSASNLISSALEEPSTTPPASRKGSTASQLSAKTTTPPPSRKGSSVSQTSDKIATPPSSRKGSGVSLTSAPGPTQKKTLDPDATVKEKAALLTGTPESIQKKRKDEKPMVSQAQPTTTKDAALPETRTKSPISLPKACPLCKVDLQKEPPNFDTCTECKNTVCNRCGFNPMPHETEKKEWLCLNCQMQRAQAEANKVAPPVSPLKKTTPAPVPISEKEKTAVSSGTPEFTKENTITPKQKPQQQEDIKKIAQPSLNQSTAPSKTAPTKEESGFFGFGRSRSPSPQPAASSVSGKVFGFGSSLLSSASNLMSTAVQDESSTTPLATQEDSAPSKTLVKTTLTQATTQGGSADLSPKQGAKSVQENQKDKEQEGKMKEIQAKAVIKEEVYKSEPPKACPLCKAEIIKNPPNYSTCTTCKNTVCNLCGFNPLPHQTEMKEWLCLNCQIQRAPIPPAGQPGPQTTKLPPPASPQKQHTPGVVAEDQKLDASGQHKIKPNSADLKPPTSEAQKQKSEVLPAKSDQPHKPEPSKQETDFFSFGFGGSQSRSQSPQPTVSAVSDKVFGFGSSFLNSASNLISSAEPSKTPPTSRKGSTISQTSSKTIPTPPTSRKGSVAPPESKLNPPPVQSKPTSTPTQEQKGPPDVQPSKPLEAELNKEPPKSCPLCKETLKKTPQNYSSCTSCKSIVCNLCGFNPNPHQTDVKEWLCLTCQMHKTSGPPLPQPEPQSNIALAPASPLKEKTQVSPSPEKKPSVTADQDKKPLAETKELKTPNTQKSKGDVPSSKPVPPPKGEQVKEESSFFGFGFGSSRSRSPSPSPQAAVSDKVFGFGSSFLSSASNLISSAVQDESSTKTPPTSRKGSTVSQVSNKTTPTPPTSRKGSVIPQDAKQKQPQRESKPAVSSIQDQKPVSKTQDPQLVKPAHTSEEISKACPLCNETLKKDPQNYSTCSSCQKSVCNLCGFNPNPHQIEMKEWLCLTCQVERASGPPPAQQQVPLASTQKKVTLEIKQTVTVEQDKKLTEAKEPTVTPTAYAQKSKDDTIPSKLAPTSKVEQNKEDSGFFGFGARSRSPSPQSAVSGKVLGFGSSFLSSASNLISSAIQDESSSKTPPSSRKGSTVSQSSIKTAPTPPTSRKGSEAAQAVQKRKVVEEAKVTVVQKKDDKKIEENKSQDEKPKVPVDDVQSNTPVPELSKVCPICKVDLKSNPSNYNTCTGCKTTVCNLCGFSPMPHQTKVKEWLCLNCQVKKAQEFPSAQPPPMASKASQPTKSQDMDSPIPSKIPVSSLNMTDVIGTKSASVATENQESKPTQASSPVPQMPKSDPSPTKHAVSQKAEPLKEEAEFFSFGFGGARSGSPQPSVTAVSGKVLGFGSSFLSSASNLISTAMQDDSSTTPPTSRKASMASETSAKNTTPPTSRKASVVSQTSLKTTPTSPASRKGSVTSQQIPPTGDTSKAPIPDKTDVKQVQQATTVPEPVIGAVTAPKAETKTCPLCKVDLNIGSKVTPNYNTCTECKKIVCNLCGFNPTPHQTEFNEWLCLNCQTQRALNGIKPQEPSKIKTHEQPDKVFTPALPQKSESITPGSSSTTIAPDSVDGTQKKEIQAVAISDRTKPAVSADVQKKEAVTGSPKPPESNIKGPPVPSSESDKPPEKATPNVQTEPPKQESSFFGFGFGSPKMQPASPKSSESTTGKLFGFGGLTETARSRSPSPQSVSAVSGKVLGLGSSIFSSASNLISSAVQDEPSKTPPTSRKGSTVSQTSTKATAPTSRKGSAVAPDSSKVSPVGDTKTQAAQDVEKKTEIKQVTSPKPPEKSASKEVKTNCPICKVKLNIDSKDAKNFNTCTECKMTVCSQCGFNPMPHQHEVEEWLCLNCQVQRAQQGVKSPSTLPQSVPLLKDDKTTSKADKEAPAPVDTKPDENPAAVPTKKKAAPDQEIKKDILVQKTSSDAKPTDKITSSKDLPKQDNTKTEPEKSQQPPTKDTIIPVKSAPPTETKPPKQESSFLGFGLGGPKAQPSSPKPTDSGTGRFFSGFGGLTETARSRSPSPQSVSAVSGKVLGLGSSIFSSASNLISSAVQDESSKTPPTSRKGSTVSQTSTKATPPTSRKGSAVAPDSSKVSPPEDTKTQAAQDVEKKTDIKQVTSPIPLQKLAPKEVKTNCPLCKVELNIDSKDAKNFNTCTECKMTVCSQCGFNPMPHQTEVDEWLCLNCQVQRAQGGIKSPPVNSQTVPLVKDNQTTSKVDKVAPVESKPDENPTAAPIEKKVVPTQEIKKDISVQKTSSDAKPTDKITSSKDLPKQDKTKTEPEKTQQQPTKDTIIPVKSAPPTKTEPPKQESSFFGFGLGGSKAQPPSPKPTDSATGRFFSGFGGLTETARSRSPSPQSVSAVSGKVLGLGSSIFSSASNLINSAVQDESSKTPPTSRKGSTVSQTSTKATPPTSRKGSAVALDSSKVSPVGDNKSQAVQDVEKKTDIKQVTSPKPLHRPAPKEVKTNCPLCKVELNIDSKDAKNFNTCTECKMTVCSQCGFNPMPHQTEVDEWLCLNCQVQRAQGGIKSPPVKPQTVPLVKDNQSTSKADKVAPAPVESKLDEDSTAAPTEKMAAPDQEIKKDISVQKTSSDAKSADMITSSKDLPKPDNTKPEPEKTQQQQQQPPKDTITPVKSTPPTKTEPPKQESGFFGFGLGGPKAQPPSPKPMDSATGRFFSGFGGLTETARSRSPSPQSVSAVSGKVLGLGSSIFSSASNLISSAVQDESSKTPPTSRKGSTVSQTSTKATPPTSRKGSAVAPDSSKVQPTEDTKTQAAQDVEKKTDIKQVTSPKPLQKPAPKEVKTNCPLCKVELNIDSKDVKNFNTCTECKMTVCSQCGFNPMPHQTDVDEWLCLNCQVQRAQGGIKSPTVKPQTVPLVKDNQTTSKADKVAPAPVKSKLDENPTAAPTEKKAGPAQEIKKDISVQKTSSDAKPTDKITSRKDLPEQDNTKPEPEKTQQQPPKDTITPVKSAPPTKTEPPKQESGFFGFGLGGPKAQPPSPKPTESTTGRFFGGLTETARSRSPSPQSVSAVSGKVLGFGSSLFSSASNLISSAVQDEPPTTPPTSRKGSTVSTDSGKATTAPASRKGSVASARTTPLTPRKGSVTTETDNNPPAKEVIQQVEKKPEQVSVDKLSSIPTSEKDTPESGRDILLTHPESLPQPSTCPLCKIALNMDSKDPPNYNTCTECKSVVCQLCGFNPMPHLAEAEWLCLNCQTQRAITGQLGDMGKIPIAGPVSAKDKPTVTSKTQLPETPAPTQVAAPQPELKPSTEKQAKEEKTTVEKAAVTTPAVPASLSVVPTTYLPQTEMTAVVAPIPAAESQKAVVTAAEVTLTETGRDKIPDEIKVERGPISMIPAATVEADVVKVKEDTYTHPTTEGQLDNVVIQIDTSLTEISKVDTLKADTKEQQRKDILPVSVESYSSAEEELKEIQRVSEMAMKETAAKLLPVRAQDNVKQYHEDSSESEPSPQIQRRRVRPPSSSSEDYKIDSSNSGDDEEFIRRQLMSMGEDENLPSDEENIVKEQLDASQETKEVDSMKPKRALKKLTVEPEEYLSSHDQDDQVVQVIPVSEALEVSSVEIDVSVDNKITVTDTIAAAVTQKSPVRQTTEEYESLVEDSSKGDGSSSVQVSSITPGTASPTSVSSIDEDSDSSPSHKKARAESKQQRKAKHRPHGQALATIEDSSEEDGLHEKGDQPMELEEERDDQQPLRKASRKMKTEKDELVMQRRRDHLTKTDKLRQVAGTEERKSSSFSDFSPSVESDAESAEYRTLSSETQEAAGKPLKNAEEVYEEMMLKAQEYKTSEKFTPPDIEPLYGGMLIEDYAYETLVDEQDQAAAAFGNFTHGQDRESVRILMTPDEAYEEMMRKRSKIVLKEEEAQQTYTTKIDTSLPLDDSDTCFVTISGNDALAADKNSKTLLQTEDAYEELLKAQKDVLTPGTSPTPSTPLSPASPLTVSESSYDSPEVILIPSSGEEDNLAEPIECILEPYITESTSTQDAFVNKTLYPIPDLKITQCSSGEDEIEEEDIARQEQISPEPTDVSLSEEEPQAPGELFENDPISVVCEVPSSKYVVETTTLSPLSPPTSPAISSPDSNLELATAPSSSPMSDQTSELTTPASPSVADVSVPVVIHMPDLMDEQTTVHPSIAASAQTIVSSSPAILASHHVSEDASTPAPPEVLASKPTQGPKPTLAPKPTITKTIQQAVPSPEWVSTNTVDSTQKPLAGAIHEPTSVTKSAITDKPTVAPMTAEKVDHVKMSTTPALTPIVQSQEKPLIETSIVVQMPDHISSSLKHPVVEQTPVSAPTLPSTTLKNQVPTAIAIVATMPDTLLCQVTSTSQSVEQASTSVPTMVPSSVPASIVSTDPTSSAVVQVATPPSAHTTLPALIRDVQPPASVSIQIPIQRLVETRSDIAPPLHQATPISPPVSHMECIAAKTVSVVSPTITTTVAFENSLSHPVKSMLADSQPTMTQIPQKIIPDNAIPPIEQKPQSQISFRLPNLEKTVNDEKVQPVIVSVSPITYAATVSSFVSPCVASAKPYISQERTDKPVISFPPPPLATPPELPYSTVPRSDFDQQMAFQTTSSVTSSQPNPPATVASVTVKAAVTPTHKSPPPVPPKPVCIPPGLVFSHRSRESIKPPVSPEPVVVQAVRAATLPRTREPPNALTLSLTAPIETKHSASSPKSPLSPRFARTLETYVVITLPSEPGSPVETITTQAPIRRSSLPTSRQQVTCDAPIVFIPAAIDAPVSLISAQVVAAPPKPPPALKTAAPFGGMAPDFASTTMETYYALPEMNLTQSIAPPCVTVPELPVTSDPMLVEAPRLVTSSELAQTMSFIPHISMGNVTHSPSEFVTPHYSAPVEMAPPALISAAPVAAPPLPPTSVEPTVYHAMVHTTPSMVCPPPMASASTLYTSKPLEELPITLTPMSGAPAVSVPQNTVSDVRKELEMQQVQTAYSVPITITQIPIQAQNEDIPGLDMEEVLIVSAPEEILTDLGPTPVPITQQTIYEEKTEIPSMTSATAVPPVPVTFTQFTKSIESQEICGQDKFISSMSQVYSAISTTEQHPDTLPKLVTQVVTTEVQRTTTVSVVQERIPVDPIPEPVSATVTIQPEVHQKSKQNGRIHYPTDVVDLTTFKVNVTMTDSGMDLTAPDSSRSFLSSESSGRQATAVQPEIVNLSAEIIPSPTLSVVNDSITIVTCTATIAYNNNSTVDKPLDLGNATSVPLSLTTYNPFEPLAQIVYRPVNSQPKPPASAEIPVNLSNRSATISAPPLMPLTVAPVSFTNGTVGIPMHTEPSVVGPVDLTTSKPLNTMVALSSSSGVVTNVVEDDGTPVDLTSGRRTVCCDVIYRLPFTGSCRTQPPVTTQPDTQIGYEIDDAEMPVIENLSTMKTSISDSNFKETGLLSYERKNGFTYQNGAPEGAMDLTSAKMSMDACICLRVVPQCFGFASC
nr:mucin-16 isoform X4 [Danio rerio]|eukprot:XP_017207511.1 mucin-16 isoform X4 [Danio rerio]